MVAVTKRRISAAAIGLYAWGPDVPAEFLLPNDVAELMPAG